MGGRTATLQFGKSLFDLSLKSGSLGADVADVSRLGAESEGKLFTFDPGFNSTASCESKITFIDGERGILLYRGYPIEQLASHSSFLEVCFLLLHGELPSSEELTEFSNKIADETLVDEQIHRFFNGFRRDTHPMAMMLSVVGFLSGFYMESSNIHDENERAISAIRLIAKMPTLAAMCYKYSKGEAFIAPKDEYSYSENFLRMMFKTLNKDYTPDPILAKALDRIFTLHADHEQNASTSTVRTAGSTGANPYACVVAGIAALWGPAHGGANEAVLNMLHEIGDISNINKFIARAKDPKDDFRLMGFGHRVYKNYDPRATIMRQTCHEVLEAVGKKDEPILKLAMELERIALEDPYFKERKLYPNVDFYSGITLSAMGIPTTMFTVMFALARTVGWVAQWNEMISGPYRLNRPRQLYTGSKEREYPSK